MHGSVLGFFAYGALQTAEVAGRHVLEVGSLDVNGSVRPMVEARQPASYLGVDVEAGPGVDRVLDAADLVREFGPDAFDVVISTEMLEHATDWQAAVANMVAVLRPGGVLVWTTRSPGFAYHHPPDRWRYTQQAMAEILAAVGLEPLVLMDDPEHPGVFVKARKPESWQWRGHWFATLRDLQVDGVTPVTEPQKWLGLPANPDGCGYYRFWQPWAQLRDRSGHTVAVPPPGQHRVVPDDDAVDEVDLLAQQRPGGRKTLRDWQRWKGHTALVYETDDNLLDPDPSGLPTWMEEGVRDTVVGCLELADLVTVSTAPLAEALAGVTPAPITVIPNHIHADLLRMERPRRDKVTVGWAGGFTHLQDLVLVQQPLKDLLHGGTKVRRIGRGGLEVLGELTVPDLHMVGNDYRPLVGGVGRFTLFRENIWDYYAAIDFDIGIAPLADTPFNRCRSPIKALEWAALGIPTVASDLEPYREFVVDGVTGFLCRSEADWYGRLRDLVHDEAMREEMGAKAKEQARGWTIQEGWSKWRDAYEEVASE